MATKPTETRSIITPTLRWIDVPKPNVATLKKLQKEFQFHPLDIEDCMQANQYPKLDGYPHYLFLVLHFPSYSPQTRQITATEIDFFIYPNALITVHEDGVHNKIDDLFLQCSKDPQKQTQLLHGNPSILLYTLLEALLKDVFPLLGHIRGDLQFIERQIFAGYEKTMVQHILQAKRNIVNLRSIMQSHEFVIQKLIVKSEPLFSTAQLQVYYNNLVEHTKDIWAILQNEKETIEALQETNESLISFRLNDIMKLLTGMSVVLLPVTLIASVMGMNVSLPFLESAANGFWYIVGFMVALATTMVLYFKHRDWL